MKQHKTIIGASATVLGLSALFGFGAAFLFSESATPVEAAIGTNHIDQTYTMSTGTFTVTIPEDAYNLRVTVIGGGGGGGGAATASNWNSGLGIDAVAFGGGGGSGCAVYDAIPDPANVNYGGENTLFLGRGGFRGSHAGPGLGGGDLASSQTATDGYDGLTSSAFGITAAGGQGGTGGSVVGGIVVGGVGGSGCNNGANGETFSSALDIPYTIVEFTNNYRGAYWLGAAGGSGNELPVWGGVYDGFGQGGSGFNLSATYYGAFTNSIYRSITEYGISFTDSVTGDNFWTGNRASGYDGAIRIQYSLDYIYYDPKIKSISPAFGSVAGGDTITIRGVDLDDAQDIMFGGAPCGDVNIISDTEITCVTSPNTAGLTSVTLVSHETTLNTFFFYVDESDGGIGLNGLTPHIGENGNWWIGDIDTGVSAQGPAGPAGANGIDGKDGKDGVDGKDGLTPHIGANGNWWIGDHDTGVSASGTGVGTGNANGGGDADGNVPNTSSPGAPKTGRASRLASARLGMMTGAFTGGVIAAGYLLRRKFMRK